MVRFANLCFRELTRKQTSLSFTLIILFDLVYRVAAKPGTLKHVSFLKNKVCSVRTYLSEDS